MLRALRGRMHEVMTAVFLARTDDGRETVDLETTRVWFRDYDDRTIDAYVASGEPMDKAGAYGIQGQGATLVARYEGSWSNVVGLPVERLGAWLARIGIDLDRLIEEA
jgi:septum formation protein